jgi:hypothetical protein
MRAVGLLFLSLALPALFLACGGRGASPSTPVAPTHAPGLSSFLLSPKASAQGAGGGKVNVVGLLNFTDGGGDLTDLTLTCYDSMGAVASTMTSPLPGAGGTTAGTLTVQLGLSTAAVGDVRIEASATDALGAKSNTLVGMLLIETAPSALHSPCLSDLQFTPASAAKDAGGGRVVIVGSFKFSDAGGDMTSFTLSGQYADGYTAGVLTCPISGTAGVVEGLIQFSLSIPSEFVTTFLLEVSTTDQQGTKSNTLADTFRITPLAPSGTTPESEVLPMIGNKPERPLVLLMRTEVSTSAGGHPGTPKGTQETM